MRALWMAAMAVATFCNPGYAAQAVTASAAGGTTSPEIVGSWGSAPYETPLATDFDRSVWGPDAKSVRNVELTVRSSGEGTLTVSKVVLDAKGKAVRGSASIEEAQLMIGELQESTVPTRREYAVTVVAAERRYTNDPGHKWTLDGLRVRIFSMEEDAIEIRFDTPEARGSFWDTLYNKGARK